MLGMAWKKGRNVRGYIRDESTLPCSRRAKLQIFVNFILLPWQVDRLQNTVENGYGAQADPSLPRTQWLRLWAQLLLNSASEEKGEKPQPPTPPLCLPTYDEAAADKTGRYLQLNFSRGGGAAFLDTQLYQVS